MRQGKYKPTRFSCKQRAALLSVLYQCMALAAEAGLCGVATKILGRAPGARTGALLHRQRRS